MCAQVVTEKIDFDSFTSRARFPWDEWTDGQTWSCEQGKDFQSAPAVFSSQLRARAAKNKVKVQYAVKKSENGSKKAVVVFKFSA